MSDLKDNEGRDLCPDCGNVTFSVDLNPAYVDFTCTQCGATRRVLLDMGKQDFSGPENWKGCCC